MSESNKQTSALWIAFVHALYSFVAFILIVLILGLVVAFALVPLFMSVGSEAALNTLLEGMGGYLISGAACLLALWWATVNSAKWVLRRYVPTDGKKVLHVSVLIFAILNLIGIAVDYFFFTTLPSAESFVSVLLVILFYVVSRKYILKGDENYVLIKSARVRLALILVAAILLTWLGTRIVWLAVSDTGIPGPYSQTIDDSVQFQGAWRVADDPRGYTGQAVLIDCREGAAECVISQSFVSSTGWVYSDISYYDITEFGNGMIRAEQDGFCANTVLTADATNPDSPVVRIASTWKQEMAAECYFEDEAVSEWILDGVENTWFAHMSSNLQDVVYDLGL